MQKKLTKIGNSHGIIISKDVLHAIGASKDSKYEIRATGTGTLEIRFEVEDEASQQLFIEKTFDKYAEKYDKAFKRLAQ